MDQSKWAIPRMKGHTTPKELGKFQRPRLKLHAVWVQQVGLYLNLVDPRQSGDATLVCEAACLALERVASLLGDRMPLHISIICDNTVRENKNNTVLRWLSWAIARFKFRSGNLQMARVGHTHGPLGTLTHMVMESNVWIMVCGCLVSKHFPNLRYVDILADIHDASMWLGQCWVWKPYEAACSFLTSCFCQWNSHRNAQSCD